MAADNKYSKVLLELKTHYQETIAELEAQASQLKTKIASLDTLIEDPLLGSDILSILQGEADSIESEAPDSIVTNTVEPKAKSKKTTQKAASKKKPTTSKKPASTAKSKGTVKPEVEAEAPQKKAAQKVSPSSGKRKSPTSKKSASAPKSTQKVEPKVEATSPKAAQKASSKKSSTPKKTASQNKAKKTQKQAGRSSSSSPKMNKPYDQMSKIDAITQIMKEQSGNLVHMDDLILKLYGELSGDTLKVERKRMHNTMYQGTQKNLWVKSPNVPMSYIFEGKSQAQSKESKPDQAKKSQKKT
ncbi:hypothetical protein [Acaryochloris sp. CCMEE 5410]|uniref:hypothetical protein n=1 Tax=Acaryochloris sp. CCMEE 5410 TaxID=310037 RepID=UPI00024848D0|nr:hypothetical protein [Acaryochloris sp. CCMEE 5410]KAI9129831.1 hypothetical protein ON05_032425 [Acaryochloris sp. CCMEE 5410]